MQSVHTLFKLAQLRCTGHVTRMPDERLPKKVLYGQLQEGKRSQGGQKKHYKDTLKASLKDFNIPIESWEQAAQDRTKWRCLINKGASQFEEKRICKAKRKRKVRKARAKEPSSVSAQSEFTCSICNRQFRAKIGLYSHHQQTLINALYSGIKMVFLSNERRTKIILSSNIPFSRIPMPPPPPPPPPYPDCILPVS